MSSLGYLIAVVVLVWVTTLRIARSECAPGIRTEHLPVTFPRDDHPHQESDQDIYYRMRDVNSVKDFVTNFLQGYPSRYSSSNALHFEDNTVRAAVYENDDDLLVNIDNPELTATEHLTPRLRPVNRKLTVSAKKTVDIHQDDAPPVVDALPGSCSTTEQLVEFPKPNKSDIIYWPTCTRIPRCSGCCSSDIFACTAVKVTNVKYKVIRARFPKSGSSKFDFDDYEYIPMERHEKCACQCRQQAKDCSPFQIFQGCRCICKDQAAKARCSGDNMYWDHHDCSCKCRNVQHCSSGYIFNIKECSCKQHQPHTEQSSSNPHNNYKSRLDAQLHSNEAPSVAEEILNNKNPPRGGFFGHDNRAANAVELRSVPSQPTLSNSRGRK